MNNFRKRKVTLNLVMWDSVVWVSVKAIFRPLEESLSWLCVMNALYILLISNNQEFQLLQFLNPHF